MKSIVLETKALTKTFRGNDEKALDRVSLRIPEGCVYGLLGPNGAGKSTLLKIITGMVQPDEGQVLFKGQPWSRQALAKTGVLIETPPLYGNLSARENLLVRTTALGADRHGKEESREIFSGNETASWHCGCPFVRTGAPYTG